MAMMKTMKLTMLLLLRQALFSDLDVSLPSLEPLDPTLRVVHRGGGSPDVEVLDELLKLVEELLLVAVGFGEGLLVASLKLVPVKGREVAGGAGRALYVLLAVGDAVLGRLGGFDELAASALGTDGGVLVFVHGVQVLCVDWEGECLFEPLGREGWRFCFVVESTEVLFLRRGLAGDACH